MENLEQPHSPKLDDGGTVRMHPLSVVGMLDCDAEKWRDALGG